MFKLKICVQCVGILLIFNCGRPCAFANTHTPDIVCLSVSKAHTQRVRAKLLSCGWLCNCVPVRHTGRAFREMSAVNCISSAVPDVGRLMAEQLIRLCLGPSATEGAPIQTLFIDTATMIKSITLGLLLGSSSPK